VTSVLEHPLEFPEPERPRPVRVLDERTARSLVAEAWREARLTSPSGRVHFLSMVDGWLERGWSIAFYRLGQRVMLYSCGSPEAWLTGDPPPRLLTRHRLYAIYTGSPLFPGDKADYESPGSSAFPFIAELVLGVRGDALYLMPHAEAEKSVSFIADVLSTRTYGEARGHGLDVDDRRRCLDYYVELCCRAHEDIDEQFLRARSTQDLWNAVRPADDQPFDLEEHPCYGEKPWRPMPTVRGPWADAEFRELVGPIERDYQTGHEHAPAEFVNDALAHLRAHGWSVARDDVLIAGFWPDA
jgi:hypothetical protein